MPCPPYKYGEFANISGENLLKSAPNAAAGAIAAAKAATSAIIFTVDIASKKENAALAEVLETNRLLRYVFGVSAKEILSR